MIKCYFRHRLSVTSSIAFDISKNFMTVMGKGSGIVVSGRNGNGNRFLTWEWGWELFYGNGREWEQK